MERFRLCSPFQHDGDRDSGVFLQAIQDVQRLVSVYPLDGFTVDDLRGAAHRVVQAKLGLFLRGHTGQLPLHCLQDPDGGQVGLEDNIQLCGGQYRCHKFPVTV